MPCTVFVSDFPLHSLQGRCARCTCRTTSRRGCTAAGRTRCTCSRRRRCRSTGSRPSAPSGTERAAARRARSLCAAQAALRHRLQKCHHRQKFSAGLPGRRSGAAGSEAFAEAAGCLPQASIARVYQKLRVGHVMFSIVRFFVVTHSIRRRPMGVAHFFAGCRPGWVFGCCFV